MSRECIEQNPRLRRHLLRARVESNDRRLAAVPIRQNALQPSGGHIFGNIDFRLQHNAEASQRPIKDDIAIIDAEARVRSKACGRTIRPPKAPGLNCRAVAQE